MSRASRGGRLRCRAAARSVVPPASDLRLHRVAEWAAPAPLSRPVLATHLADGYPVRVIPARLVAVDPPAHPVLADPQQFGCLGDAHDRPSTLRYL